MGKIFKKALDVFGPVVDVITSFVPGLNGVKLAFIAVKTVFADIIPFATKASAGLKEFTNALGAIASKSAKATVSLAGKAAKIPKETGKLANKTSIKLGIDNIGKAVEYFNSIVDAGKNLYDFSVLINNLFKDKPQESDSNIDNKIPNPADMFPQPAAQRAEPLNLQSIVADSIIVNNASFKSGDNSFELSGESKEAVSKDDNLGELETSIEENLTSIKEFFETCKMKIEENCCSSHGGGDNSAGNPSSAWAQFSTAGATEAESAGMKNASGAGMKNASGDIDKAKESMQSFSDFVTQHSDLVEGSFNAMGGAVSSALEQFATEGKFDFKGMVGGMIKEMQIYAAQKTAILLMTAAYEGVMILADSTRRAEHAAAALMALKGAAIMGTFVAGSGLAGMAHDGISNIPKDGTWLLQKGERVVDSRTNSDLKNYLQKGKGDVSVSVAINGGDEKSVMKALPELKRTIIDAVAGDIASNGRIRQVMKVYA